MTTDEPDLTGLVLDGRYALMRRIGVGGMGAVYEARHVRISKPVAVKVLNREFAYKESFRRRFLREAQAASLIQHKHVVTIHDHGEHGDVAYIVMELLEGRDLHALVHDRAPLPWAEARGILLQTAAALGAAHERGVIHRDVKPANVFIADDPHEGMVVKVLDFGIARANTINVPDGESQGATGSSRVFGTPTYMAPEIAFGEPTDQRADIYSLGVVAYRVLTGHLPFDGDVPYVVISRHANEAPAPLRSLEPSLPRGVEQVVLKALAKRPGDRFQSMGSFARALASIDEAGRGEVPAALLSETEATVGTAPVTEPVARKRRAPPGRAAAPVAEAESFDPRRAGASESSDVGGTPVTNLGTERLPSRRRVSGVSDSEEIRRGGVTERLDGPSDELDVGAGVGMGMMRGSSGQVPVTAMTPPAPERLRRWSGLVRVLGLVALVTVAAAVGALVARTQPESSPPTTGLAAAPDGVIAKDPAQGPARSDVVVSNAGEGDDAGEGDEAGKGAAVPVGASAGDADATPTSNAADGADSSTTDDTTTPASDDTTTPASDDGDAGADPPTPTPRGTSRKPTDASVKKKLVRELRRACGAEASGYRVTIEGIITPEGRITGARAHEAPGDARRCIERVVEAQRFPLGEMRTLDLAFTL
jgi:hypothetical protein